MDIKKVNIKNILIPVDRFWPEYAGWIKQTIKMLDGIQEDDYKFEVWTKKTQVKSYPQEQLPKNTNIVNIHSGIGKSHVTQTTIYSLIVCIKIFFRKKKIQLIYLPHTRYPGFIFILFARIFKIPLIARNAGGELLNTGNLAQKLRFLVLPLCSCLIVLNKQDEDVLKKIKIPERKINLIPNGVDIKKFSPSIGKHKKNDECIKIGFLGIVCERKGIQDLISVIKELIKKNYNVKLKIAGPIDGVTEVNASFISSFKEEINKSYIEYLGVLEKPEEFLREADIFVLPSYSEGMPNALLEAMATGLPCISTRIPGVEDVIDHNENGLLFSPGNKHELEQNLKRLIKQYTLRKKLGNKARETIRTKYSLTVMNERYKRLFFKFSNQCIK